MMEGVDIRIGCSGYYYPEWKGKFYPEDLHTGKWLEFYAQYFNTIEINASFYKFPEARNLRKWYLCTPTGFTFSIKAPQLITHYKKFKDSKQILDEFYKVSDEGLKERVKNYLFQLPPSLAYDAITLDNIVSTLKNDERRNVVEFRHPSWWDPKVYEVLTENKIGVSAISFPGLPDDMITCGDVAYVRLHGLQELYKSTYTAEEIKAWADKIKQVKQKEIYVYFNNTWHMGSVNNAFELMKLLGLRD